MDKKDKMQLDKQTFHILGMLTKSEVWNPRTSNLPSA